MTDRSRRLLIFVGCLMTVVLTVWMGKVRPSTNVVVYADEQSDPSGSPASDPSGSPTPVPSDSPTPDPSGSPTPDPSGSPTPTPTPSPTPTPNPALALIKECLVLYKSEEISVEVAKENTQVYYCVLKKSTDNGGKPADFLPAASNEYGTKYYIDISTLSASKDCYIGVCTDLTPGADGLVPVITVPVRANQKKITFNVDWSYEGTPQSFSGKKVLESVAITTNNSQNLTYKHLTSAETELIKDIDREDFKIQWRKGANGDWKAIEKLTYTDWEGMKNSGAVVYFRLDAADQTFKDAGQRYSKENKIKVAITKAPSVKVDVSKLTVTLKNGMQFRVHGAADGKWYTILPYSGASKNTVSLRDKALTTLFDPFTETTSTKVTVTSIKDIKTMISYVEPSTPTALVLDVRIAATTKKPASRIGMISIPSQGAKPTVTALTKGSDSYTVGSITPADTLVASPAFEYTIVMKTDVDAGTVDYTTLKWSSVKSSTVLKGNLKGTYNTLDAAHTRRTIGITEANACLLIRRRGVNGSSKADPVLASDAAVLPIPTN